MVKIMHVNVPEWMNQESLRHVYLSDDKARLVYADYPEAKGRGWCPSCDGGDDDCDHELQRQLFKHFAAAGIGQTYMRIGWDDYDAADDVADMCSSYLSDVRSYMGNGIGMCLLGSNGIGKTTAVSLMCKSLVVAGYSVFYTTYQKLVSMLGDTFYDAEAKKVYNDLILRSSFLAIDDIGKEFSNRLTQNAIDNVLRERVQASRPTFITSNMTKREMFHEYGRASFSLIVEGSVIFEMDGTSDVRSIVRDKRLDMARSGIVPKISL